jgi:hypothetical protein
MARKVFTVSEANSLIPKLREVFRGIDFYKSQIRDRGRRLEVLGLLWEESASDPSNPDYEDFVDCRKSIEKDIGEIERLVRDEILDRGIRFPTGGIEKGLVDFPTTYRGRWVYLCWQNGEPEVQFWHETNTGFPGRQTLTGEQRSAMGVEDDPEALDEAGLDF